MVGLAVALESARFLRSRSRPGCCARVGPVLALEKSAWLLRSSRPGCLGLLTTLILGWRAQKNRPITVLRTARPRGCLGGPQKGGIAPLRVADTPAKLRQNPGYLRQICPKRGLKTCVFPAFFACSQYAIAPPIARKLRLQTYTAIHPGVDGRNRQQRFVGATGPNYPPFNPPGCLSA
jgi:hypothetical protein